MKKVLLPAILFAGWMAFLNTDIPAKGSFLPALGKFLNPFIGVWQNVVPHDYKSNLHANVKGDVRILFDERDIPHVYASNTEDALYAQGYLHAANRLFAMDLTTRSASGRLSELLGERTLAIDRKQRERGYEKSAILKTEYWAKFQGNSSLMNAYVQGVNDYIATLAYKQWPFEYKLLSHGPADWSVLQSALVVTSMAISLALSEDDAEYSMAKEKLSPEDFQFLYPNQNSLESPIIPIDTKWDFQAIQSGRVDSTAKLKVSDHKAVKDPQDLNGSNNWAVSGSKTKNGFPILANDPHLGLTLPNIWYEMEFHTPDMHVHGVTLPGLPFVIIGFNDSIAWGSTNSGQDVLDWYSITWKDSTRREYLLDGEYVKADLRPEEIKIRGSKPLIDTIRYTLWGPVTHLDEHKDMAMKWIGHQNATSNDLDFLQKMDKAKNVNDYRDAVSSFIYPAQNKVFASVQGDIAISVAGVMPIRPAGLGEYVTPGDKSTNDWQGYIPFEQAPFIINPARGYVSSGNQIPVSTTYPYPMLGHRYFEDYRGRVINTVLDSLEDITHEDFMKLQQNNYGLHAAEILPVMIKALQTSPCSPNHVLLDELANWNFEYDRDSLSPVIFEIWYDAFEKWTWDELDTLGLMRPEDWRLVEIVRDHPDHKYFDIEATTDKKETAADIACASFTEMVNAYNKMPDDEKKNWGAYKHSAIPHLARLPHFGVDFVNASGGRHIVNAMGKSNGPSWRMIVELSNPPKAWVNYPGGQSGDIASPHFRDFLDQFFEGKYYEVSLLNDPAKWQPVNEFKISPK